MDYDLWLRFAEKYPAGNIKKVLSNLRYHSQAKSGSQTKGQLKEVLGLGSRYTKPLSWRRFCQYYYFLRGLAVVIARQDITKRIERSRRIS